MKRRDVILSTDGVLAHSGRKKHMTWGEPTHTPGALCIDVSIRHTLLLLYKMYPTRKESLLPDDHLSIALS